ncbi:MAG: hypothetical protein EHM45_22580 [Desulfobacteraceae bacterium]|nr:MAG: hypothetical protein EHM45_22580 [Desulfobacteraceae bacterium]
MKLQGFVRKKTILKGTKSEHEGLVLVCPEGEFALRRQGGNPFQDEALAGLEGKQIEAEGIVRGNQFIMTSHKILD